MGVYKNKHKFMITKMTMVTFLLLVFVSEDFMFCYDKKEKIETY